MGSVQQSESVDIWQRQSEDVTATGFRFNNYLYTNEWEQFHGNTKNGHIIHIQKLITAKVHSYYNQPTTSMFIIDFLFSFPDQNVAAGLNIFHDNSLLLSGEVNL